MDHVSIDLWVTGLIILGIGLYALAVWSIAKFAKYLGQ
jgi:hypothetical protein